MKKTFPILVVACAMLLSVGCKKNKDAATPTPTNASLIAGTYTATKTEGSNTNNGTDWVDFTKTGSYEVLTLNADKSFTSVIASPGAAALNLPVMGTWALSADGNTLSYVGSQDYTIKTLTSTSMVTITKGPNQKTYVDAPIYAYYRFTYTKK